MPQEVLDGKNFPTRLGEPLCLRCRGRSLCGKPACVFLERIKSVAPIVKKVRQDFFGASPPSVFVGRAGYPDVFAGALAPVSDGDTSMFDAPLEWYRRGWSIQDVLSHRTSLVNSRVRTGVKKPGAMLSKMQEIVAAKKSVDIEAHYSKPLFSGVHFSGITAPSGPSGTLETLKIAGNPATERKTEYVISGADLKAADAIDYLRARKTGENSIMKLLSVGLLGEKAQRKLVPTRWAITAVDDALGKSIVSGIKRLPVISSPILFMNSYLGNHFMVLLLPRPWSYELMELWHPHSLWASGSSVSLGSDFEDYFGRKSYASNTQGAYYAARLAVLEHLEKIKRQASVLIVREIRPDYWAPLGVWVIRESVRGAFDAKGIDVEKENALKMIEGALLAKRTGWQAKSALLKQAKSQRSLGEF